MDLDNLPAEYLERINKAAQRTFDQHIMTDANGKSYTVADLLPVSDDEEQTKELRSMVMRRMLALFQQELVADHELTAELVRRSESAFEIEGHGEEIKKEYDSKKGLNGSGSGDT